MEAATSVQQQEKHYSNIFILSRILARKKRGHWRYKSTPGRKGFGRAGLPAGRRGGGRGLKDHGEGSVRKKKKVNEGNSTKDEKGAERWSLTSPGPKPYWYVLGCNIFSPSNWTQGGGTNMIFLPQTSLNYFSRCFFQCAALTDNLLSSLASLARTPTSAEIFPLVKVLSWL